MVEVYMRFPVLKEGFPDPSAAVRFSQRRFPEAKIVFRIAVRSREHFLQAFYFVDEGKPGRKANELVLIKGCNNDRIFHFEKLLQIAFLIFIVSDVQERIFCKHFDTQGSNLGDQSMDARSCEGNNFYVIVT